MSKLPIDQGVSPRVSVGMPVFNGEQYLCEAIESLLAQTYTDFELLISDNASTDRTQAICESYATQDARIRYVRQSVNLGMTGNFRFVLDQAHGKYFMWAAHDDIWAADWLEVLLLALMRPGVFSARGAIRFVRDQDTIVERTPQNYPKGSYLRYFMGEETTMNARNFYVYGLCDRHQLLTLNWSACGETYCPDFLFVFQMLKSGSLYTEPSTHQYYRMHANNGGIHMVANTLSKARLLYAVHPFHYYRRYIALAPLWVKPLLWLCIPVKHVYNQARLWWRGFRTKVLGLKNI